MVCQHLKEEAMVVLDAHLTARKAQIQTALEQQLSEIHARHIEYLTDLGLRNVESVVNTVDGLQTLVCRLMANPPALSPGVLEQRREEMRESRMNVTRVRPSGVPTRPQPGNATSFAHRVRRSAATQTYSGVLSENSNNPSRAARATNPDIDLGNSLTLKASLSSRTV